MEHETAIFIMRRFNGHQGINKWVYFPCDRCPLSHRGVGCGEV
jgi:hypothetical protein